MSGDWSYAVSKLKGWGFLSLLKNIGRYRSDQPVSLVGVLLFFSKRIMKINIYK